MIAIGHVDHGHASLWCHLDQHFRRLRCWHVSPGVDRDHLFRDDLTDEAYIVCEKPEFPLRQRAGSASLRAGGFSPLS